VYDSIKFTSIGAGQNLEFDLGDVPSTFGTSTFYTFAFIGQQIFDV